MPLMSPRGFEDLGRMVISFQELGSTGNHFKGSGEQAHSFGDLGSPAKNVKKMNLKNLTLKETPPPHFV